MSFWRNQRYTTFERQASGDPIRGLARQDFPWKLISATKVDPEGDAWVLEIQASNIGEQDIAGKVLVSLEALASCQPSRDRLRSLGFDPERLTWLGLDEGSGLIRERLEVEVRLPLEQLNKLAKATLERLQRYVFEKYTDESKKEAIRLEVESCAISGFGERNGLRSAP